MTDVVLTTVPTTALTVHAETGDDNTEIVTETNLEQPEPVLEEDSSEESQAELTGEEEEAAAEEEEPAAEETEKVGEETVVSEDETPIPEETDEEETEPEQEREQGEVFLTEMSETNSMESTAETKIIVKGVATNDKGEESLTDLTTAKVIYTNGCASEDGSKMRQDTNVTFRVLPTAGNKVSGVSYAAAEKDEDLTLDAANNNSLGTGNDDEELTIDKSQFSQDGKNNKNILIVVRTEEIKYAVTPNTASATGVAVRTPGKTEDNKDALVGLDSEYPYSKANSIKLAMTGMTAGTTYKVTAKAGAGEAVELKAGAKVAAKGDVPEYIPYTLNVSALKGVDKYADQSVSVTVEAIDAVTVKASAATVSTAWTNAGGAFGEATIASGKTGYTAYKADETYNVGTKVAFQVTDADGWTKVDKSKITAKLEDCDDPKDLPEITLKVADAPTGDFELTSGVKGYYVQIPVATAAGYTLKIAVDNELNDEANKITFTQQLPAGADKVITIKGGESAESTSAITKNVVKTTADDYYVNITSREGYQMQEVQVTLKGVYTDEKKGTLNCTYTLGDKKNIYAIAEAIHFEGTNTPGVKVKDENGDLVDDGRSWEATEATVNIIVGNAIEGADEDKAVQFHSTSAADGNKYEYKVQESEQVTFNKTSGKAVIAEGTQYLNFTVAAETKPQVELKLNGEGDEADTTGLLECISEKSGEYGYRVAAKALIGDKGHIFITRTSKTITATFESEVADVKYKNTEDDLPSDAPLTNGVAVSVDKDAELEITVDPKGGTAVPIASVTYKVGKETAKTAQPDGQGKYVFSVKASENVAVEVKKAEDERLFIKQGDKAAKVIAAGGTVDAGYEEEIQAWLQKKDGTKVNIINASVTDGGVLAETKASIEENVAKLKVAKNEYEKELTVTLMKKDRTTVSFTVVSDRAVEKGISFVNAAGEAVTSASPDADTEMKLWVKAESGNVNKLDAVVIDTPEQLPEEVETEAKSNDNIEVAFKDGALTIIAKPAKDKVDKAGTILIYDKTSTEKKTVLASMNVSVKAPVVLGVTAEAKNGVSDGRSIAVKINVPDVLKSEVLKAGSFGYEIKVTAPASLTKPANLTDEEWDAVKADMEENLGAYQEGRLVALSDIIAKGGHTITVLSSDVKPAKIGDFKIDVTPVQFTDKNDQTEDNKISGKPATVTASTTAPVYSDTLKLGKGESSLTTGRNADIVVATPEFAKDAQYKSVEAEIIDNATGKHWQTYNSLTGQWVDPFAGQVKWNAVDGTVTVNAKNLGYISNAREIYKNIAVKVTAFTEDGDYGVSGVKKLSVVNGIQDMSLDVQPEILYTGKKVTIKSAITYNNETTNKKYAPKKKAVTYSIVGAGSVTNDIKPLSAALSATVDSKGTKAVSVDKNGKITVAAGFVPSKNSAENQFRLLAVAADYEGNTKKAITTYDIEIVSKDTTMGKLEIFVENGGNYYKVPAGDLPVEYADMYTLAVLKPGIPEKNSYNLSEDTVDHSLLDFKSSNKNIKVDSYGGIEVKKLGKANFTVSAKSNSKNKVEMKNVNFVMEKTDLYVAVTRYQDSTFKKGIGTQYFKADAAIDVTGNTTGYYSLNLVKATGDEEYPYDDFTLPNCTFSFKNAKQVTPVNSYTDEYDEDAYFVATGSTGKAATIVTVTNKGVKPAQKINITINNATAVSANAPKLALTNKRQSIVVGKDAWVNITVTAAKKGETIPANTYVMLSADQTKKTKANVNDVFNGSLDKAILLDRINDSTAAFNVGMYTRQAESYTLIATLGTMTNGVFTQTHKEARITLKAGKANENIKATSSYTLNPYGISSQKLAINGGDGTVEFTGYANRDGENNLIEGFNYAKNQIQKNGTPNEFNKYFKVTAKEGTEEIDRIMVNPELSYTDLQKLDDKDFQKANTTGYITVTNGYKQVDVKLTVKLKAQKDLKIKATAAPVIAGTDVITDIQILDGKTPVALETYAVSGGKSFQAYYTTELAADEAEAEAEAERRDNGIIRVKAATAAKGSDKVDVKVLLADTALNYRTESDNNKDPFAAYGITISGVSVTIAENTKANKVVLSANDKKWKVQSSDWAAKDEFYGWSTKKDYSFTNRLSIPEGSKITVSGNDISTSYVSFESDGYNASGRQELTIKLDKDKLKAAMTPDNKKLDWGKTITATAEFSYAGTTEDGEPVGTSLKKDTVKFSITLPEQEGYASADALNDAIEADRAVFQNLVDVKTAEHYWDDFDEHYTKQDAADDVAGILEARVRDMAKGTTAVISAAGEYDDGLYTYTLTVNNKTHEYKTLEATPTAASVAARIDALYKGANTTAEEAKELGLSYYPATTASDLETSLRKVLAKENLMTNNISLSVKILDTCVAPKAGVTGKFNAKVTVRDRNMEPEYSYNEYYEKTADVNYTFPALDQVTKYTTGTDKLVTKLNAGDTVTAVTDLFSKAYTTSNGDIAADHEIGKAMKAALIAEIEAFAKKQITNNTYLSVKGIDADGFECNWDNTNSKWVLAFDIVYTDSTPKTKTPEIKVPVAAGDNVAVVEANVKSIQQAQAGTSGLNKIKTDVATAMAAAKYLIKPVTTKEAAIAEIEKMVKEAIVSPKYDAAKSLEIVVPEDGEFVAYKGTTNGKIDVKVTYNKDKKKDDAAVTSNFTFVIAANKDALEADETNVNMRLKAKGLVQSTLTDAKINAIVKDAWNKHYTTDATKGTDFAKTSEDLLGGIKEAVENSLTNAGFDKISVDTDGVAVEELTTPSKSNLKGEIKGITVTLKDSTPVVDPVTEWAAADKKVTVAKCTLNGDACYQSKTEFLDTIKTKLQRDGLAYKADYFDTDGSLKKSSEAEQKVITDAIGALAKTYADDATIATNPQWKGKTFAVAASATQIGTWNKNSVSVTFNITGDSDAGDKRDVNVKLLTEAQTPTIKSIKVKKVGATTITDTTANNGSAADKAIEIASNPTTDQTVSIEVAIDATNGTSAEQKTLEWAVASKDVNDLYVGVKNITIKADAQAGKATLTIPKDAYAANGVAEVVKLVGTIKDTKVGGTKTVNIFVSIGLEENVTGVELKATNGEAEAPRSFEAPAEDAVTYSFDTKVTGTHVRADTKAVIDTTSTGDDKVELGPDTNTWKAKLVVKAGAAAHAGANALKVTAKVGGTAKNVTPNTITIIPHADAAKKVKLALGAATDTSWANASGTPAPAYAGTLTVSNKTADDVKIPINITDPDKHQWDAAKFTLAVKTDDSKQLGDSKPTGDELKALVAVEAGRGVNKDTKYLVIKNAMPALTQKKADKDGNGAVEPVVLELTAVSDATAGKAAVTQKLAFALMVNKTFTDVTISAKIGEVALTAPYEVTQKADEAVTVDLKAMVNGAHVNPATDSDDQKVTWKITSQGAKSTASITDAGVLTIPAKTASTDNIIKVTATAKENKEISKTISIKVKQPDSAPVEDADLTAANAMAVKIAALENIAVAANAVEGTDPKTIKVDAAKTAIQNKINADSTFGWDANYTLNVTGSKDVVAPEGDNDGTAKITFTVTKGTKTSTAKEIAIKVNKS